MLCAPIVMFWPESTCPSRKLRPCLSTSSYVTCRLDAETLGLLHDLRYRGDRILWGGPEAPFVTEFSFRRHLAAEIRTICRKAGIPKAAKPLHDLRRTCATLMADAGVPAFALGQVMGHQSVATTAAYYVAPNARRAADRGLRAVLTRYPAWCATKIWVGRRVRAIRRAGRQDRRLPT